jgi:transposase
LLRLEKGAPFVALDAGIAHYELAMLAEIVHRGARRVGAHRQSVSKWAAELEAKGRAGLKKAGRAGRKPRLSAEQISQLEQGLKRGPQALGYETSLWTANRVARLIEQESGVSYHPGHVWKILRQLGWSCQRPAGRALERDEKAIERWQKERWPELKKGQKAGPDHSFHRRERAQRAAPSLPHLGAAGTDPGAAIPLQLENPVGDGGGNVVEFLLSALSRRYQKSQVVEFLEHLLRHLPGKLLIIWDGLPSHRSHLVWDFVRQQRGRLWLEFLPAYAPELNPVEYLWSHWKQHELPNFCPSTFAQLSLHARRALKRMRQRPTLVLAFWQQARLFPL